MTRAELLRTFNERFYIWLPALSENNMFETVVCSDVHEGIAKALEYFALVDVELSKRQSIHIVYPVSLSPLGDWVTMPIGPAWRLCSPVVQDIVEEAVAQIMGQSMTDYLTCGDVESFEEIMSKTR